MLCQLQILLDNVAGGEEQCQRKGLCRREPRSAETSKEIQAFISTIQSSAGQVTSIESSAAHQHQAALQLHAFCKAGEASAD